MAARPGRARPRRHRDARWALGVALAFTTLLALPSCSDPDAVAEQSRSGSGPTSSMSGTSTTPVAEPAGPDGSSVVPGALRVTGGPAETTRVGPAAGSELDGIDRDAGISVRLRDDSTLWLFGDTARANDDGSLAYFTIGTAAWARPGTPTVTQDYASGGEPIAFATPVAGFPPCPGSAPVAGMWPSSAVVQPVGDLDRVVVWLENICLGSSIRGAARGMAVAEWYYDPSQPPVGMPIQARILNQTLFGQRSFGLASMIDGDAAITYSCQAPEQGGSPETYGPCLAARVPLDQVANPAAYRPWDGTGWGSDPQRAVPLALAAGPLGATYPAGSFSVVRDPHVGAYVMVYSPWPGYSDALQIRTATSPTGPWGPPVTVPLTGCSDDVAGSTFWCYAAAAQPILSEPGHLGVGYYDRRVSSDPVRGSYLVTTVPYEATPPDGPADGATDGTADGPG